MSVTLKSARGFLRIFGFAFLLVAPRLAEANESEVRVSKVNLRLLGKSIRADVFERGTAGNKPAIVVLHGAGGMLFDGPEMRRMARDLAAAGNAVYIVRYFEQTGTLVALDSSMEKNFGVWLRTVREAVVAIQELRRDSSPVGIYGYSLGGFLSLFAASENRRIGAVVEHAGGIWEGKTNRIRKMPPVLMVHGEQDGRVPFEKYATPLVPILRKRAERVETRFFPQEGHNFSAAAMAKVRAEAARFFRRHLGLRREA